MRDMNCESAPETIPQKPNSDREMIRLLKFSSVGAVVTGTRNSQTTEERAVLVNGERSRELAVSVQCLAEAIKTSLISESKRQLKLTDTGKAALVRLLHPEEGFSQQHIMAEPDVMIEEGRRIQVTRSRCESPLDRLHYISNRSGRPYLTEAEYEAGQRVRRDFEKTGLQPSITQNWASLGMAGRGTNGEAEISDLAIDARKRLEHALEGLGPELAGVTLDVCCFLKGLETVERERKWPQRSAKLMLKTALSLLVRHYGVMAGTNKETAIRSWGGEGYRPTL